MMTNKTIKFIMKNKNTLLSFSICFIILLIYAFINRTYVFIADSSSYNVLSDQFNINGVFHFTNFPDNMRGYFFPYLLFLFKSFGIFVFNNPVLGFLLFNSFMLAILITIFIPSLFHISKTKKYLIASIVITVVFIYFWPDFLIYPLSDVYALFFFCITISCLMKLESQIRNNHFERIITIVYMLLLGASIYASYNTRTVYQIPNYILIIFFVIRNYKQLFKEKMKSITLIILVISSYFITALPQMQINEKYNDKFSSKVITEKFLGNDLSLTQLFWGIEYARYETDVESIVGNPVTYPVLGVRYVDQKGKQILNDIKDKSYFGLIKSYLQHPIEYFKIYVRHAVNGFMPIYRESYIRTMNANKVYPFVINYIILLIFFVMLLLNYKYIISKSFYTIGLLLVSLIAIPGAIEVRFVLPAFMMIYAVAFYMFDYKRVLKHIKNMKIVIPIIIIAFIGFIFSYNVLSTTLSSTEEGVKYTLTGQ